MLFHISHQTKMSTIALLSSPPILTPPSCSSGKTRLVLNHQLSVTPKRNLLSVSTRATDSTLEDQKVSEASALESDQKFGRNGSPPADEAVAKFEEPRWVNGTWDLKQFAKDGKTDWDAVIDAEVRRRKWLENNPESTNNVNPIVFDTSIIPWWAWVKRFHLPEAERLNGRAAMIGFFMAYFVDSLTGVGLVDQMGNFFCKTLLFVAVAGVLLVRKNEDLETLKRLVDESTFYDKQWQATWKDETKET